jgi:hypothetical protein
MKHEIHVEVHVKFEKHTENDAGSKKRNEII